MTSPFGTIITPSQVEVWVEDFAKKWFVEYLAEVERQLGLDPQTYPDLRSYVRANDFDHWPEDQLPSLMVMNMGLADEPIKRNGGWDAKWMIGAAIIVSGYDRNATRDLMNNYGAAFRAMILQTRSLEREEGGVQAARVSLAWSRSLSSFYPTNSVNGATRQSRTSVPDRPIRRPSTRSRFSSAPSSR